MAGNGQTATARQLATEASVPSIVGARAGSLPDKLFYRIGEVCRLTDTKAFVLRYWETEFPTLQPVKTPKGHRLYRREDIETVLEIKRLLYEEGFTIAGARRHLAGHRDPPATAPAEEPRGLNARARRALVGVRDELHRILTLVQPR